jgi:hypothetical protein
MRAPSRAPKTSLNLFVSVPRSSRLTSRSHSVTVFPLTVNNADYHHKGKPSWRQPPVAEVC